MFVEPYWGASSSPLVQIFLKILIGRRHGTHFRYLDLVHITVGKRDPPAGSLRLLDNSRPPVSEVHLIVNFPSRQELDHESFGMIESQC